MFYNFCIRMTGVIEYLHFGPGVVSVFILAVLIDIEDDPTVAARINFPFYCEFVVLIFGICYQVATSLGHGFIHVKFAISCLPARANLIAFISVPPRSGLAIKQELPPIFFLLFTQGILCGAV